MVYDFWCWPWLPGLGVCVRFYKVTPFSYCALWKEVTLCSPHLRIGFTSLRIKYRHKLFGILLHGKFVFLHKIYVFNYLFIPVWTLLYLFCTLVYNAILLYLFIYLLKLPQLFHLAAMSFCHLSLRLCFILEYFLTFWPYKIL